MRKILFSIVMLTAVLLTAYGGHNGKKEVTEGTTQVDSTENDSSESEDVSLCINSVLWQSKRRCMDFFCG